MSHGQRTLLPVGWYQPGLNISLPHLGHLLLSLPLPLSTRAPPAHTPLLLIPSPPPLLLEISFSSSSDSLIPFCFSSTSRRSAPGGGRRRRAPSRVRRAWRWQRRQRPSLECGGVSIHMALLSLSQLVLMLFCSRLFQLGLKIVIFSPRFVVVVCNLGLIGVANRDYKPLLYQRILSELG